MNIKNIRNILLLVAIVALIIPTAIQSVTAAGKSRAPESIGTTLAFDDGKVVTIQYSQNYFCESAGPATNATFSPCKIGIDAIIDPVPDVASNPLNVIVPAFLSPDQLINPALGGNNFTQCPETTTTLKCINHPAFTTNAITGVVSPVPVHSHIISGNGVNSAQGGWWKLNVWAVTDPTIWPDPKTGVCSAGTGCLTSNEALNAAAKLGKVQGPIPTNIYLFFNVVNPNSK